MTLQQKFSLSSRGPGIGAAELRSFFDLGPDPIFIAGADGQLTYVNDAACGLLGYERPELLGHSGPAEFVECQRKSRERIERGAGHVVECQLQDKAGRRMWVEVSARLQPDGHWQGVVRNLSERDADELGRGGLIRELETERGLLRTLLETLPLGVMIYQREKRLLFNQRTEEVLGMKLSPVGGWEQYAGRVRTLDGVPVPVEGLVSFRALQKGETITAEEFLVERPDGSRIPVLASAAPMRDSDGRVIAAVGVFQDVSERMRMELAIRANERQLQDIINILPVGVWVADSTGQLLRTNPAGERIWGGARLLPKEEFGQYKGWWLESGKPISAEEWGMARAITRGETSNAELVRIQSFDGRFKTIIHSAAPMRDEHGRIVGGIVVNEDITALHQAQEKLRANELLLRTVFNLLPVGLWLTDAHGNITLANPAGERIWGGTQYVGPTDYSTYKGWWVDSGEPIGSEEWALWRAIHGGHTSHGELIRIQTFDGAYKTIINWAAPIRSQEGEILGAVAVNQDVSFLVRVQEQLRTAVRDREQILATVTHDLRNPLTALTSAAQAAELAAAAFPEGQRVRTALALLLDIARRMSGLVDDLLAVTVSEAGGPCMLKIASVVASDLAAQAADAVRLLTDRRGLELKVHVAQGLPEIPVDRDRVLRVFANLLDNAIKNTTSPGRITIDAEAATGGVLFRVSNTGPALTAESLTHMFRPFWQAGVDRQGAGLGLSICRSIIEAHGGTIWAEPADGQRVRICFILPVLQTQSSPESDG